MYSNPHQSEKLKQIFKDNLYRINNYTNIHNGKKINYQDKLEAILNDKKQYSRLVKSVIEYRKQTTKRVSSCVREAIRDAILDYTLDNKFIISKYLKANFTPIKKFSNCINVYQHLSHLRDEKYTDKLHNEIVKYIDDEKNNHCDNKILFDHKKEKITKAVNAYTNQYSPTLFPKPLKKVTESFVDNGCPLTMSNQ